MIWSTSPISFFNVDSSEIIATCTLLKIPASSTLSMLSVEQCKEIINYLNSYILNKIKPDFTFLNTVNKKNLKIRLNKRKNKNRYDKFSKKFYDNVQKSFIKIAKTNRNRYLVIDNTLDSSSAEKIIFNRFIKLLKK